MTEETLPTEDIPRRGTAPLPITTNKPQCPKKEATHRDSLPLTGKPMKVHTSHPPTTPNPLINMISNHSAGPICPPKTPSRPPSTRTRTQGMKDKIVATHRVSRLSTIKNSLVKKDKMEITHRVSPPPTAKNRKEPTHRRKTARPTQRVSSNPNQHPTPHKETNTPIARIRQDTVQPPIAREAPRKREEEQDPPRTARREPPADSTHRTGAKAEPPAQPVLSPQIEVTREPPPTHKTNQTQKPKRQATRLSTSHQRNCKQ